MEAEIFSLKNLVIVLIDKINALEDRVEVLEGSEE